MRPRARIAEKAERYGPYLWAAVACVAMLRWHREASTLLMGVSLSRHETVAAVFNVLITMTGLLFSVFVLAVAPGGGFIERIFRTKTFLIFRSYVIQALILGGLGAVLCVPYIATKDSQPEVGVWTLEWLKLLITFVVLAALLAYVRVVRVFMIWVAADARLKRRQGF